MTTRSIKKRAAIDAAKISLTLLFVLAGIRGVQYFSAGLTEQESISLTETLQQTALAQGEVEAIEVVIAQSRVALEDWKKNKEGLLVSNEELKTNLNGFFEKLKEKNTVFEEVTLSVAPDPSYVNISQITLEVYGIHTASEMQEATNAATAEVLFALLGAFSKEMGIYPGSLAQKGNVITYAYHKKEK